MKRLCKTVNAMSVLVGLAGASAAVAAPVTLNFSGLVDFAVFDPFDPLSGAVQAGTELYSYLNTDTATPDSNPSPDQGSYTVTGGTYGLAAVLGSVLFPVMRTVNISVVDGAAGMPDYYTVFASEGSAGGLGDYFTMAMTLIDPSGMAITGDGLPSGLPDISAYASTRFDITGQYTNMDGVFIQYEVQGYLVPSDVPEPSTLALLALPLALLARRERRRHAFPS